MKKLARTPLELWLTAAFVLFTALLSVCLALPFSLPSGQMAAFVGVHYLYPLVGIAIWAALMVWGRRQSLAATFLIALPCYAIILLCHFNLKLWIPHVNPFLWDELYWQTDQAIYPLIEFSTYIRLLVAPLIPLDSNFYMLGFIALFYLSFGYHALRTPSEFRELVIAAMLLQIFGSLAYFVAPALGPFIYEPGVEPPATAAQAHMMGIWQANSALGSSWLAANGSANLTGGLAAMPSLHAGGSLLFVVFAWRHAPRLLWFMGPLFAFITIDALANRWHYVIDLPVGMLVAILALRTAKWAIARVPNLELELRPARALADDLPGSLALSDFNQSSPRSTRITFPADEQFRTELGDKA